MVQDHLGQLLLDLGLGQVDLLSHILDLDLGVGLDNPAEVLLQHGLVQLAQVLLHNSVVLQLVLEGFQGLEKEKLSK